MDSRDLDQRITIQSQTESRSASGNIVVTWALVTDCWAKLQAARGRERVTAGEKFAIAAYTCWIRSDIVKRFAVRAKMRVIWRNTIYEILDIGDNTEREEFTAVYLQGGISGDGG